MYKDRLAGTVDGHTLPVFCRSVLTMDAPSQMDVFDHQRNPGTELGHRGGVKGADLGLVQIAGWHPPTAAHINVPLHPHRLAWMVAL